MGRLNTTSTVIEVAAKALAIFKDQYPDRISVWVETSKENSLNVKIKSIARITNKENHTREEYTHMAEHIYFDKTQALMEL